MVFHWVLGCFGSFKYQDLVQLDVQLITGYVPLTCLQTHKEKCTNIHSLTNRKVPDVHLDVQGGLSEDPGGDLWPAALTKRLWAEMEDKPQSKQLPSPKPMTLDILKPTLRIHDGNQTNRQLYSRIDRFAVSVFLFINSTKHYMQYRGQGFKLFW